MQLPQPAGLERHQRRRNGPANRERSRVDPAERAAAARHGLRRALEGAVDEGVPRRRGVLARRAGGAGGRVVAGRLVRSSSVGRGAGGDAGVVVGAGGGGEGAVEDHGVVGGVVEDGGVDVEVLCEGFFWGPRDPVVGLERDSVLLSQERQSSD